MILPLQGRETAIAGTARGARGCLAERGQEDDMIKLVAMAAVLNLSVAAMAYAQGGERDPRRPPPQSPVPANAQAAPLDAGPGQQPPNSVRVDSGSISVPGQAMHTDQPATANPPTRPCSPGSQSQTPPGKSPGGAVRHEGPSTRPCPR